MAKTSASFRLEQTDVDRLHNLGYDSPAFALEHVMDGYFTLREYSLYELRGYFERNELIALIDRQNGVMLDPRYQASMEAFLIGLEDFENLQSGVSLQGANYQQLVEKIKNLNRAQLYFLQEEIDRFWNAADAYGSPSPDLDKFLHVYAPQADTYVIVDDRYSNNLSEAGQRPQVHEISFTGLLSMCRELGFNEGLRVVTDAEYGVDGTGKRPILVPGIVNEKRETIAVLKRAYDKYNA